MRIKRGFTLVELLAVIVVLGIIVLIAVPKVTDIIDESKTKTMISSVKSIINSAEREYENREMIGSLDQNLDPIECGDVVSLSDVDYENCVIEFDENGSAIVSVAGTTSGKFSGKFICEATENSIEVTSGCNSYISNGLVLWFDGVENTESGHSASASNWFDLSGNNHHGSFHGGPTWGSNYLQCDGVDDDVYMDFFFHATPTIEVVYSITTYNNTYLYAVYDLLGGGFTLFSGTNYIGGITYVNNSSIYSGKSMVTSLNTIYSSVLTYDGTNLNSYLNGELTQSVLSAGTVSSPTYDTIFALCAKSYGSLVNDGWSNLKIYSVRIYDRVLTESELYSNYLTDSSKFGI